MLLLVVIWALAEALLWFIVADVPIMATGALYGRRRALWAALAGALAAALGGVAMLLWARADPAGSMAALLSVPGVSPALYDATAASWRDGGTLAMMTASFTGVPYKLFAHAAGMDGTGPLLFALQSVVARLPRFAMVALVSGTLAVRLRRRLGNLRFWALFAWTWAGFYAWYWHSMGVFG